MTPNIVADEAFAVPHMLGSFSRREIDPVYLHSIGVPVRTCHPWLGLLDVAVSSSSELPESYHISIELPGFIQPLLPFPSSLFLAHGKSSGSHHSCQLVGDSSLEGVHQDVAGLDTAMHLG